MYAAAGGASLASRQARQRQRQDKKTQQVARATNLPAKQPQQFPNYTDHAIVLPPRLSRVERNALRPPTLQPHAADRRHSTSNYHLRSSTCTGSDTPSLRGHGHGHGHGHSHSHGPSQHPHRRLRESPSICIPVQQQQQQQQRHVRTAAHLQQLQQQRSRLDLFGMGGADQATVVGSTLLQLPQVHQLGAAPLERRCSFVRQVEEMERPQKEAGILDRCNHMCNFEVKPLSGEGVGDAPAPDEALLLFSGGQGTTVHAAGMAEYEREAFGGSMDYPFSECSQGRAAWVERERGRRCSGISEETAAHQQRLKQSEAHHRWMKRNRIHDTSYGGSSDGYDDDYSPSSAIAYHQSAAANALLYVGLGTAALGSIIFFVGTGEKGFKTLELRLIGPTLVACGLLCCLVRILLCACPATCHHNGRTSRKKELHEQTSTCCQQQQHRTASATAAMLPRPPSIHQYKHKDKEKEKENNTTTTTSTSSRDKSDERTLSGQQQQRTRKKVCITTTTTTAAPPIPTYGQHQRTDSVKQQQLQLIIPTISEPSCAADVVELVPLDAVSRGVKVPASSSSTSCFYDIEYELQSVSDDNDDDDDDDCEGETVIEVELPPKHSRSREPCNSGSGGAVVVSAELTTDVLTTNNGVPTAAVLSDLQSPLRVTVTTDNVMTSDCSVVLSSYQHQQQHSGIVLNPSQLQTKQ